jgi:hypothetical protein
MLGDRSWSPSATLARESAYHEGETGGSCESCALPRVREKALRVLDVRAIAGLATGMRRLVGRAAQDFARACKGRLDASTNVKLNFSFKKLLSPEYLSSELESLGYRSSRNKSCDTRVSKGHPLNLLAAAKSSKDLRG